MQILPSATSSFSSSSQPQAAPIERLAKDLIANFILPYLFKKGANEADDSYIKTKNRRAIFVASRLFSELESHVLIMRPDYLGEVLSRSGLLQHGRQINPYFDSIFTKKVRVSATASILPKQRQQKSTREIESRFLFTAIEIKHAKISKAQIARIVNKHWFPNLQQITFNHCVLTAYVLEGLVTMKKLTHFVLKNCTPYQSLKKDPQAYVNAIAKMGSLILLRIEGGDDFLAREEKLQPWKLPKLQTLELIGQVFRINPIILSSVATGSELHDLNLARGSLDVLGGITMAHLRRLNLNEPHLFGSILAAMQGWIVPFISRHPLLEEVLLRSSQESARYIITVELMQALVACKQLKKLDFFDCLIPYASLKMLADADLCLEELNLDVCGIDAIPEGKTWKDALLLVAQMRSLKKLEIKNGRERNLEEQEAIVQALASSLTKLESFTFHHAALTPTIVKLLQQFSHLQTVYFSAPPFLEAILLLELIREGSYLRGNYEKLRLLLPQNTKEIIDQLASETSLDLSILDESTQDEINETILNKALHVRPFLTILNATDIVAFTDQVIQQMAAQTSLEKVALAGTSVTADGVEELFRKCPHLTDFTPPELNGKERIALLQHLGEQNRLQHLDLWNMSMTDDCLELELICQMSALKVLSIMPPHKVSQEQFSHILKRLATDLPNLEKLYVNGATFSMDVVRQLCSFEALRYVHFKGDVERSGHYLMEFLYPYWQTEIHFEPDLDLKFNETELFMCEQFREGSILDASLLPEEVLKVLDDELVAGAIIRRPWLTRLVLTNASGFTDAGIEALENLKRVTEIDLSGTSVTFQGIQKLVEKCPHLTNLSLSYTKDFDKVAQSMQGAKNLRSVHIVKGQNAVQVQAPHMQQVIKSLPQLTVLGLYGLDLTQKGVITAISHSSRLQTLFLNESSLSVETCRELITIPNTVLSRTLRVIDSTHTQFPAEGGQFHLNAFKPHYLFQEIPANQRNFLKIFQESLPHCQIIYTL